MSFSTERSDCMEESGKLCKHLQKYMSVVKHQQSPKY